MNYMVNTNAVRKLFALTRGPVPWARMSLCCFATSLPLVVGGARGQVMLSVFGALTGYLLVLNNHFGNIKSRVGILTLTFILLIVGFGLGALLHGQTLPYYVCVAALTYWVGVLGGQGAELERAILFLLIANVVAYSSPMLPADAGRAIFFYALLAYLGTLFAIPVVTKLFKQKPDEYVRLGDAFSKSFSLVRENHIHAASFTLSVIGALAFSDYFQVERGYWIVVTVLLVMRADRKLSLFVSAQRLVGTAAGVLFCDLILLWLAPHPNIYVLWVGICGFVIPYFLTINYLWASFFNTTFVVALLEMDPVQYGLHGPDTHSVFLRLKATLIGCAIGVGGTAVSKVLATVLLKRQVGE